MATAPTQASAGRKDAATRNGQRAELCCAGERTQGGVPPEVPADHTPIQEALADHAQQQGSEAADLPAAPGDAAPAVLRLPAAGDGSQHAEGSEHTQPGSATSSMGLGSLDAELLTKEAAEGSRHTVRARDDGCVQG